MLYMQIETTLNRRRRSDVDRRRETDVEQTLFQRCFILLIIELILVNLITIVYYLAGKNQFLVTEYLVETPSD